MSTRRYRSRGEYSLSDMLSDPIIQAIMACDGVTKDEVEGLILALRHRLTASQTETRAARRRAVLAGEAQRTSR